MWVLGPLREQQLTAKPTFQPAKKEFLKQDKQGLERWVSGYEHWLLLQEDPDLVPSGHMAPVLRDLTCSSGLHGHRACKCYT